MIKWVIKRDGRKCRLKADKIKFAVWKSYEDLKLNAVESELDDLATKVVNELNDAFDGNIHVDEIQNAVERNLMLINPNVAKNFILYRNERDRQRTIDSSLIKAAKKIKNAELKSNNAVRDNANENGQTPAGQFGKVGSEMQKTYNLLNNIDRRFAEEHVNGELHIHDLNFYDLSFNCLFAPVGKLLKTGFDSGTGFLRTPKSINTAAYLTSVILQLQSNQQFGGIASDNVDFDLAPYVDLSFKKNLIIELTRYYSYSGKGVGLYKRLVNSVRYVFGFDFKYTVFDEITQTKKSPHYHNVNDAINYYKELAEEEKALSEKLEYYKEILNEKFPELNLNDLTLNYGEELLLERFPRKPLEFAIKQTDRDTYQAMEGLVANLNSLQSRSGNQVPFSSLNFGLDTSICGRMVSKNLIKAQMAGLGDGLTAIFPILIFKLMKGVTFNSEDPNYDLYLDSIRCLARRFYPNFVGVDNKFNAKYIKYDEESFKVTGDVYLHEIGTNNFIKLHNYDFEYEFNQIDCNKYEIVKSDGSTWQVLQYRLDDDDGVLIDTQRLKPETTVATMGCRTRVIGNKNGKEQTTSRGNLAFHTMNLPRLAIQAHIESQDYDERKKIFFKKLQSLLEDAKQSLIDRYNLIAKKTYENFPFTMQQGLYLTSDDTQHKLTDTIGEVLKQGTLSIGYIGIYETLLLLTGKVWGKDEEIKSYGIEIVKYIHNFCKKCEKETEFNWSCFATPAESVAGRFCSIDKNLYQGHPLLKDVNQFQLFDKGYYTNSHMLPFDLKTTIVNKVNWEAPFHELTTAGHIFYHKIDGDLSQNLEGVKRCIDYMYNHDLGYFTVTMDSDTCINKLPDGSTCGFHGVIDKACPKCGCTNEDYFIRVRRITGYLTGSPRKTIFKSWNDGKLAELKNRQNI